MVMVMLRKNIGARDKDQGGEENETVKVIHGKLWFVIVHITINRVECLG
jgi:hypothetical protein